VTFHEIQIDPENGIVYGRRGRPLSTNSGDRYVQVYYSNQPIKYAHRVIWEYVNGPIPEGMTINHIDGNKRNNKISNLECIPQAANNLHAYRTGLKVPYERGGSKNPAAKLTETEVIAIRELAAQGVSRKAIREKFGMSKYAIECVIKRKSWANI
jgi:hypothetical protein